MKVLCIAASQVTGRGADSYSYVTSTIIEDNVKEHKNAEIEIVHLAEKELIPCCMCAKCADDGLCVFNDSFNEIHNKMKKADLIFIICPHYAGLPSKLTILLEKLEEVCYILMCKKETDKWLLKNKPVGLVVHGGSTEKYLPIYKDTILKPLSYICRSIGMQLKDSEDYEKGIIFGVTGYDTPEGSVIPNMVYDWDKVKEKLAPFVEQYLIK